MNIPSRSANFIHRFFEGRLDSGAADDAWEEDFVRELAQAYERRRYHEVVRAVMARADAVNAEVDAAKPWLLAKEEGGRDGVASGLFKGVCGGSICWWGICRRLFPVLPSR